VGGGSSENTRIHCHKKSDKHLKNLLNKQHL
jgi:hypothetical protein